MPPVLLLLRLSFLSITGAVEANIEAGSLGAAILLCGSGCCCCCCWFDLAISVTLSLSKFSLSCCSLASSILSSSCLFFS